jgi:hypothetical protein
MTLHDWIDLLSLAGVVFVAGGIYQQIKQFREDFKDLKPMLLEWKAVMTRVGTLENVTAKMSSDHRELRASLGQARERLASMHDVTEAE